MAQPPRVFETRQQDRRNPERADRRAEGRTFAQRIEAARQEGQEEGITIGAERTLAEVRSLLASLAEARRLIEREREGLLEFSVTELARLSVKIAEKVLGEKLESDPGAMITIVRNALATLKGCGPVEVRLNAEDVARGEAAGAAPLRAEGVTIVFDATIPRGGCRIKTDWGEVGAGAADQIRRVEAMFDMESDRG